MTEILCLVNSRRENERCVAGIELRSGKLIRPVNKSDSQAKTDTLDLYKLHKGQCAASKKTQAIVEIPTICYVAIEG